MMSKELKIAFFATMSAGKTTCINALLGTELLHSANEATTATITTIHYSDVSRISAYDGDYSFVSQQSNIDAHDIQKMNANEEIKYLHVQSDFSIAKGLTIVDTPGPNNSVDDSHAELSYKYLQNHDIDCAIYLINATQPFINDDLAYLKYIANKVKKQNIIFVVNKIDELDFEVDSVEDFMKHLKAYLLDIGFTHPMIFMVSAYHALVVKKLARRESLTRKERRLLSQLIDDEYKNPFLQYLKLSKNMMFRVKHKNYFEYLGDDFEDIEILNHIYCQTGVPYFEEFIQYHLNRKKMALNKDRESILTIEDLIC